MINIAFYSGSKYSPSFVSNLDSIIVQYELPHQCETEAMQELKKKLEDKLNQDATFHCSVVVLYLKGTLEGFPDKQIEFLVKGGQVSCESTF